MKRFFPFIVIGVVFFAALVFGFQLHRSTESANTLTPITATRTPASAILPGADPPHAKGADDATVTLEEFGDFECPACGQLYQLLKTVEGQYAGRVRVIFRHFPLAQHQRARQAAQTAEAAGLQGSFWQMHDKLYEGRTTWSKAPDVDSVFSTYARELGMDLDRFDRDRKSDAVRERVQQDFERGRSLRIRATPTIFLNGVEIPYRDIKTVESLRHALDNALKERGQSE